MFQSLLNGYDKPMRRHPYLAVFLIGWGVPLVLLTVAITIALIKSSGPPPKPYEVEYALGLTLGAGLIPIVVGWLAIVTMRSGEMDARFRRGITAVVVTLIIVFGLMGIASLSR
jgi:hypothetical protein